MLILRKLYSLIRSKYVAPPILVLLGASLFYVLSLAKIYPLILFIVISSALCTVTVFLYEGNTRKARKALITALGEKRRRFGRFGQTMLGSQFSAD